MHVFSCSFACAGALKFVLFALGAKRPPKQIHRKNHYVLMNFQCSRFCRGRREEGTRGSKREPKQHTKNTTKTTKPSFFSRPRAKPPKKRVKTAKKAPPGGHNDPQERPRRGRERPKRSQDDPKSAPRAPQEPPRGGLRAALVATWGRPGAQEAPGALRGALLAPSGVDFGPSEAPSPAQPKPP